MGAQFSSNEEHEALQHEALQHEDTTTKNTEVT